MTGCNHRCSCGHEHREHSATYGWCRYCDNCELSDGHYDDDCHPFLHAALEQLDRIEITPTGMTVPAGPGALLRFCVHPDAVIRLRRAQSAQRWRRTWDVARRRWRCTLLPRRTWFDRIKVCDACGSFALVPDHASDVIISSFAILEATDR